MAIGGRARPAVVPGSASGDVPVTRTRRPNWGRRVQDRVKGAYSTVVVPRRREKIRIRNPRARRARAPITMATMSAPVKARPDGVVVAVDDGTAPDLETTVIMVVAVHTPPPVLVPEATMVLATPNLTATAGPPLRERVGAAVEVKVSGKVPAAEAVPEL